ncbi:hypothetical protein AB4Y87_09965 [Paenarthrobacter sp. RAF54_2]|uniref:hypothetical protein n=1 Tax=unclassified Paenarthrobacter TaxID=2634190 RepID=UPI003F983DCA
MNVRRIRFVAVGVGVGVEMYDDGTSPPADSPPFAPGTSGEADAEPGGSSDVVLLGAVLSDAAQAVKPARREAPNTPKTARLAGVEAGAEMGTAEWSPHMAVPYG